MSPRTLLAPLLLSLLSIAGTASAATEPRLVRVPLGPSLPIERLLAAGLDIVEVRGHDAALVLEWPGDEARLASLGASITVVDEAPGRTAALRADRELAARPAPAPVPQSISRGPITQRPPLHGLSAPPFGSGSMGGYWTTVEVKMKLDDLVAKDTHDVVADTIGTLGYSREGRPVWSLELGKHVVGPDTRPVAFFNALAHAREPGGMQAIFYFVDHILGGYGVDPFATYLLDHRRIVIVPIVNPDGYAVNEATYTTSRSFGLWRKNTRDNNGNGVFDPGVDGVDLNRNFGFKWGLDDLGSSPDPTTETYRGPAPFSEVETQIQRTAVATLQPKTGISFHTYQDLLLHAWGYTSTPPVDAAAFHEWNDLLSRDNAYQSGQAPLLLYSVNGEFNDWCYGDTLTKPRAFTWTPEIGNSDDFFWPPPSRIVPLAQENLRTCYMVAAIAGPFVQTDGWSIVEGALNASYLSHVVVRARNVGAGGPAGPSLTGTMTPLDAGVSMVIATVGYPTLGSRQSADPTGAGAFQMVVHDTVTPGRLLRFRIDFTDANGLFSRDTISVPCGTPTVLATENASGSLGQWTISGGWGIVQNDPGHLSRYVTESPSGTYPPGANLMLTLTAPLNLSAGVHAYAVFDTRWDFETNYDAGLIEASSNGGTSYQLVRSTGTTPGSGLSGSVQTANQPYLAGTRWLWKTEWADLSPFTGPTVTNARLRLRVRTNVSGNFDGLSFDSLRVLLYDPAAQPALVAVDTQRPERLDLAALPNPASRAARLEFSVPARGDVRLDVLDVQGRVVRPIVRGAVEAGRYAREWNLADEQGRRAAPGMYFIRLVTPAATLTRRVVVVD